MERHTQTEQPESAEGDAQTQQSTLVERGLFETRKINSVQRAELQCGWWLILSVSGGQKAAE